MNKTEHNFDMGLSILIRAPESRLGLGPAAPLLVVPLFLGSGEGEKPAPSRADTLRMCWHGPILEGYRMNRRIWAGCFVFQILDPHERMVGVKWQALMALPLLACLSQIHRS